MRETLFSGDHLLTLWLWAFLLVGLAVGIAKGFIKARKIQPKGFKWITLRNESVFAVINLLITGFILGNGTTYLKEQGRSEEHTSELQSLMRISYAVFCLKKKNNTTILCNNTFTFTIQHNDKHN